MMSINFLSGGLPDYEDTHDFAIRQKLEKHIAELEALLDEREEKQTYWFRKATQYSILLDKILDAEIPWAHGHMKLRHTAVVKDIIDNQEHQQ
jgi:crotonobetainyl-CoA:carnitine CoA-transferase CaiB-like acyl-CoA transferase